MHKAELIVFDGRINHGEEIFDPALIHVLSCSVGGTSTFSHSWGDNSSLHRAEHQMKRKGVRRGMKSTTWHEQEEEGRASFETISPLRCCWPEKDISLVQYTATKLDVIVSRGHDVLLPTEKLPHSAVVEQAGCGGGHLALSHITG